MTATALRTAQQIADELTANHESCYRTTDRGVGVTFDSVAWQDLFEQITTCPEVDIDASERWANEGGGEFDAILRTGERLTWSDGADGYVVR